MTPSEFKAWFEGFTEDMDERPSAKQWKRIKERVKQIDNVPYVRYPYYQYTPHWAVYSHGQTIGVVGSHTVGSHTVGHNTVCNNVEMLPQEASASMFLLGRHDSRELDFTEQVE